MGWGVQNERFIIVRGTSAAAAAAASTTTPTNTETSKYLSTLYARGKFSSEIVY